VAVVSRLGRRIGCLEARWPPPTAAFQSVFDTTRLSPAEQVELDDLLRPLAPLPGERWNLAPLTMAQLDRAHQLVAKGHERGEDSA